MEVPSAAAELAAVTALCKNSTNGMQAGGEDSNTTLQAWNILQALTAFYSKMDAAAGAADATAADGSWLSALQDAVAMLLAALLVVTPNADHVAHSSKSELMLQLFAVQKQLSTAQGNVQQLMGRFMERLAAHCTAV